jgi:hypothetical protein
MEVRWAFHFKNLIFRKRLHCAQPFILSLKAEVGAWLCEAIVLACDVRDGRPGITRGMVRCDETE